MKKVFSLMAALAMMATLSACGKECVPEVIEEEVEVIKEVEKEVIKEVKVPNYIEGEFDYEKSYQPGTYFKATEADENGVVTFATVVVDKYGRIAGVKIDNTTTTNKFKIDEETDKLYVYVPGVEDVIPNAYRYVDLSKGFKIPTIEDGFIVEDLIEGFPAHDEKIATLKDVKTNETQQIVDSQAKKFAGTWSDQMDKLAARIVEDQTTYGINLYAAGAEMKTNSVDGVTVAVGEEIELVQSILDNEAKLGEDTTLATKPEGKTGLYTTDSYYEVSNPQVGDNGVIYNTAFVVVDEFGTIAGVKLDETYNGTTKWVLKENYNMKPASPIGKEWFEQVEGLENAIVRNQSIDGFKYISHEDDSVVKSADVFERAKTGVEFETEAEVSNVAGTTIMVNGLLEVAKEAIETKALPELQAGAYQAADENGNIMSVVVAPIITAIDTDVYTAKDHFVGEPVSADFKKDGITVENRVISMTLDTVYKQDQAYITVDGEDYELYSYERGSLDLALEEVKTPTLIYKDGDTYRYAETNENPDVYEAGDVVKFDYAGYNEQETIKPVVANSTKQSLKDRYGMATTEGQLEWYEQANAYTNAFIGKDTAYVLNMVDAEKTDTLTGVTMAVNQYNDLAIKTLLAATDKDNAAKNIVVADDLTTGLTNGLDINLGTFVLANGSYYATSDIPNEDGGFYTYTMTVYNNKVVSIALDETYVNGEELTTKVSMGDDFKVDKEGNKSEDKNDKTYTETIGKLMADNMDQIADLDDRDNGLLDGYDYELDTELEEDANFFKDEAEVLAWNDAAEKTLLTALKDRVGEVIDGIVESVEKQLTNKNTYVVASDNADAGKVTVKVPQDKFYLDNSKSNKVEVDYDLEEVTDLIKVNDKVNEGNVEFTIEADADDVTTSTKEKVRFTVEYDDYEVASKEIEVKVQSLKDYKQSLLDSQNADGEYANEMLNGLTSNELVSGQQITLQAQKYDATSKSFVALNEADRIGENKTNKAVKWMIKSVNDATLEMTFNKKDVVKYDGRDFLFSNVDNGQTYTINGYTIKLSEKANKTYDTNKFYKLSEYDVIVSGTPVVDAKDQLAKAKELFMSAFVVNANKLKVEVAQDSKGKDLDKGSVVVRAYFDDYDQDDEFLNSYQKGEAYRDFEMTVYSNNYAYKLAKQRTEVGNILDTVTNETQVIDLTESHDLNMNHVTVRWAGQVVANNKTTAIEVLRLLTKEDGTSPIKVIKINGNYYEYKNDLFYLVSGVKEEDFTYASVADKNTEPTPTGIVNDIYVYDSFDSGKKISEVFGNQASYLNALKDGFQFVKSLDEEGNEQLQLEVKVNNANSSRVELKAQFPEIQPKNLADGTYIPTNEVVYETEFVVAKASDAQFVERMEEAIKDHMSSEINLNTFVDYADLESVKAAGLNKELPTEADLVPDGNATDKKVHVEFKWYYEDGREVKHGHLGSTAPIYNDKGEITNPSVITMPTLGKVLKSQIDIPEFGETVETKVKCVATYDDATGVEHEVEITFNTTIYNNAK